VDTVKTSLRMMREIVRGVKVNANRMLAAAQDGFMNATDLADYLVDRGEPFRSAHEIAGRIVQHCIAKGRRIEQLPLEELRDFSEKIEKNIHRYLSIEAVVGRRKALGGTARNNVLRRLKEIGSA
jgi:argininosuccinate lyase